MLQQNLIVFDNKAITNWIIKNSRESYDKPITKVRVKLVVELMLSLALARLARERLSLTPSQISLQQISLQSLLSGSQTFVIELISDTTTGP